MSSPERLVAALADRYRIERELGAGGMATVYLAQDLKHDRQVAIKVLRPELAAVIGAERFLSEIRTTANLQHPHILSLFDSGEAGGSVFYVMPYVDGESLRSRLEREHQLPVDGALQIAREVADALEHAHQKGVIHRDIKPENILLHGGHALVADFGIALAVSRSEGGARMTETGMSLGTPHYMSPEQAMGERTLDARTDVYALGCVLYEMLLGEPPFSGPTAQAIVAKVMTERPAGLIARRDRVPPQIEDAVLTALEKLPADRWASAAAFRAALADDAVETRRTHRPVRRGAQGAVAWLPWGVAAGLGAAALLGWLRPGPALPPAPVVRFTIPAVTNDRTSSLGYSSVAVSPDGQTLVYVDAAPGGRRQLVTRRLDQSSPLPLPGSEDGTNPFFSPDGKWVAFIRGNQIYKVALGGGSSATLLAPAPGTFDGAAWAGDGTVIVSGNRALYTIPENGGAARLLPGPERVPGELYRTAPLMVDQGRRLIYASWAGSRVTSVRLAVLTLGTGAATVLDLPGIHPLAMVDDVLIYAAARGLLMAVRLDVARARVLGQPVQLADNISTNSSTGLASAALSATGTLIYQSGSPTARVVIAGLDGRTRPLLDERRDYTFPRLSPDGSRLAVSIGTAGARDVWVYDLRSATLTRLTQGGPTNERAEWSPDGKRVLYRGDVNGRPGIWWRPTDLSAESAPLLAAPDLDIFEAVISPDGQHLIYQLDTLGADIYYRGLGADSAPHPISASATAIETMPRVSPDGRWVAFVTNESGRDEVVVQPFPGPGGRVQVSSDGGTEPLWSRDGKRLFFRSSGHLLAARIAPGTAFTVSARDTVLNDNFIYAFNPHPNWDVLPDGNHFLFLESTDAGEMTIIANWHTVLRQQMGMIARR